MARWHFCNLLNTEKDTRRIWQFQASSKKFGLTKEETKLGGEPLSSKIFSKDWETLVQPKLNVALLPPDHVFLRVIQIPKTNPEEVGVMVELQLEKLSPMPVAQVVWSYGLIEHPGENQPMQTAVVIIVARQEVDKFMGQLEAMEFFADRLELSFLDQVRSEFFRKDGAWVYPGWGADANSCLVAWWKDGILRDLSLVHLPVDEHRARVFQDQIRQIIWTGELAGWMDEAIRFYLVAEPETGAEWMELFEAEQAVELVPPIPAGELAVVTAKRAVGELTAINLLPEEYTARYKQRFLDKLWMRGVGATIALYMIGVAIYFGWVEIAKWKLDDLTTQLDSMGPGYTNVLRLKEKIGVLQDQLDLQYAALDCWKAAADNLPAELTLDSINFDRGFKVTYFGFSPSGSGPVVNDFNEAIRSTKVGDRKLFSRVDGPRMSDNPSTRQSTWSFACYLDRKDVP